jgi:hypothetical protein
MLEHAVFCFHEQHCCVIRPESLSGATLASIAI